MLTFFTENWGTIVVAAALGGVVCAIVAGMVRDKRRGRSSCGCGCANCAMSGACHKKG